MDKEKKYKLYAGVNGAGKSTLYHLYDTDKSEKRINSDEILKENGGDWRNISDQGKAMKEAVLQIKKCFQEGTSFNQETTLTGKTIIGNIRKAKELGYSVELHYVGLDSPELAMQRVKNRVNEGGHGIDEATIRSRYNASLENLKEAVLLCDKVIVYDNSKEFKDVGRAEKGAWVEFDKQCAWLHKTFPNIDLEGNRTRKDDISDTKEKPSRMSMQNYMMQIKQKKDTNKEKHPDPAPKNKGRENRDRY